jgi:hypothetical protein
MNVPDTRQFSRQRLQTRRLAAIIIAEQNIQYFIVTIQ